MSQNLQYSHTGGKMVVKDIKHFLSKSYDKNLNDHGDYKIDKSLSGTRAQVYHNPNKNHTVVVHKGTDSIHDWITDLRLGLGDRSGKRFKHAKDVQQKAEQKYANSNVSTLGHSLGSKLAEEASQNPKNEIITLNNPTVISDLIKKPKSNVYNIRTSMDPVSILRNVVPSKSKNDLTIKSTSFNPLTEHKTDTLNRINQEMEIGQGIKGGGSGNVTPMNAEIRRIQIQQDYIYNFYVEALEEVQNVNPQIIQDFMHTTDGILDFVNMEVTPQNVELVRNMMLRSNDIIRTYMTLNIETRPNTPENNETGDGMPIAYETYKQFSKKYKIKLTKNKKINP